MPLNYRQWSSAKAVFHPHKKPDGRVIATTTGPNDTSPDILSLTMHKDIGQAAGGFTMTLAGRQNYLKNLAVDDWVELFLDNGTSKSTGRFTATRGAQKKPTMLGCIDRISRGRQTDEKGTTRTVYYVSGRDYGKVLMNIQLIVDPLVGAMLQQATFNQEVIVSSYKGDPIPFGDPSEVVSNFLKLHHDSRAQFKLPDSLNDIRLVKDFGKVQGKLFPVNNPNLTGNLWSTMEAYAHLLLNEFYVDTVEGDPTLVLQERPYSHDKFQHLDSFTYMAEECNKEDIGKGDSDIHNWFRVHPDSGVIAVELAAVNNIGLANQDSIARHGLRKLELTTNAFAQLGDTLADNSVGIPRGLLQDWSELISEWNVYNEELLAGSYTGRLRPDARIGMRMDYVNNREKEKLSFFVEGVTHNFVFPGASSTSFNVTRGVERVESGGQLSFPLLKSATQLQLEDFLSELTQVSFSPLQFIASESGSNVA